MTIDRFAFRSGDLYLFHRSDPRCPAPTSLWGVFARRTETTIYLEAASEDLLRFWRWYPLPSGYRYCRLSARSELRDFMANVTAWEMSEPERPVIKRVYHEQ